MGIALISHWLCWFFTPQPVFMVANLEFFIVLWKVWTSGFKTVVIVNCPKPRATCTAIVHTSIYVTWISQHHWIIVFIHPFPSKLILTRTWTQSKQILAEVLNKEFHNNLSIVNYTALLDRWTDIKKLVAALLFATRWKNKYYIRHLITKTIQLVKLGEKLQFQSWHWRSCVPVQSAG